MSKTQKTQRLARVALTSFVGQDADGNYVAWPRGSAAISSLRALARRGAATETTGACEGCESHRQGHEVPVFVVTPGVYAEIRADVARS